MKVAMLSPIAWRTPPRHYGPWENVVSLLTEALVKRGIDVTLFATGDSLTNARLRAICKKGYEEDRSIEPKVWECLHISEVFEHAGEFDLIHNNFDFLPLTYSGLISTPVITTIHGFSSPKIYPVYQKYNDRAFYVSISKADRLDSLDYVANVYHGIDISQFTFQQRPGEYLLFFGRIHIDKGAGQAIEIAKKSGMKLIMAGIIQDSQYYEKNIRPFIDGSSVIYVGSAGPEKRDSLLGNAYALLHPINFDEPFGLSVVESMACGTPVIAFNRGSMPELISHGHNGFLVQTVDEAVAAVHDIPMIKRSACRRVVEERFTADRMAEKYIDVYRRILKMTRLEGH
ncbi:D-inositol-3-phosphate glycosyltransferase [subsurface metagenome]